MRDIDVAIVGAGPYGLSLAAHLRHRKIDHRIFGKPMQFWGRIAQAADKRYLKSYCFGTNLSSPSAGFSFADYNTPRGLETFEPCSMSNFEAYGRWFQENEVPYVEPIDVVKVWREGMHFRVTLSDGETLRASQVVVATGLSGFAKSPCSLSTLSRSLVEHTTNVASYASFKGRSVAVIGAGQSALEAAVLLREAGADPTLLVREHSIHWHSRVQKSRSLWRRLRSPITALGTGPKAWALTRYPDALHRMPERFRSYVVKTHLSAEGAWWLRDRFESKVPVEFSTEVIEAREDSGRVALEVRGVRSQTIRQMTVDHVIAGSGYAVNVDRLGFLDEALRKDIVRIEGSPKLNAKFESSMPGLRFIGVSSAMSFGPLFRFVAGADYTARTIASYLASRTGKA